MERDGDFNLVSRVKKIFASMLVRDYQWELLPEQDLNMVAVPAPHPRDGLKINFRSLHG